MRACNCLLTSVSKKTLSDLKSKLKIYIEDILGLQSITGEGNEKLEQVLELLIEMRKEAKSKKDFATSDKIRNQLASFGILIKDEKDGNMSWSLA